MNREDRIKILRQQVKLHPDSVEAKQRLEFVEQRVAPYVPPARQRMMPRFLMAFMRTLGILCIFVAIVCIASVLLGGMGLAPACIFGFFGMISLYLSKL